MEFTEQTYVSFKALKFVLNKFNYNVQSFSDKELLASKKGILISCKDEDEKRILLQQTGERNILMSLIEEAEKLGDTPDIFKVIAKEPQGEMRYLVCQNVVTSNILRVSVKPSLYDEAIINVTRIKPKYHKLKFKGTPDPYENT